jgi:hypothetical protein
MRTVFVIGAGANTEIGMPSGNDLKINIASLLNLTTDGSGSPLGDDIIRDAIYINYRDSFGYINSDMVDKLMGTAVNISKAMPLSISIDNYIEAHKPDQQIAFCGKLAIVRAILEAEHNCVLFDAYNRPPHTVIAHEKNKQMNNSWYPLFFQKITEGCHVDELAKRLDDISFIIFNYDRCFEYFIYYALMVYYNIDQNKARGLVQSLHINHPYGTVGDLWDNKGKCTFGVSPDSTQLIRLAQRIKTFTESIDDEENSNNRIQYLIERMDRIIFLGFAYHDQNLNLLFNYHGDLCVTDGVPLSNNANCYGTGHGMSDKDLEYLCKVVLQEKYGKPIYCDIPKVTCSTFFCDFWYRLSFKQA